MQDIHSRRYAKRVTIVPKVIHKHPKILVKKASIIKPISKSPQSLRDLFKD